MEQIAVSRGFGEGLPDFLPGQSSSSSSHEPARIAETLDEPGEGFFALFPKLKTVRNWVRTRVRECTPVSAHPRQLLITVLVSGSGSWSSLIRSLFVGIETRVRHAGEWKLDTGFLGVCGPMAANVRLGNGQVFETLDGM